MRRWPQRRHVTPASVVHIGKETNRLDEVAAGLVTDPDQVYTVYEDHWCGGR